MASLIIDGKKLVVCRKLCGFDVSYAENHQSTQNSQHYQKAALTCAWSWGQGLVGDRRRGWCREYRGAPEGHPIIIKHARKIIIH